ncbi:hypothetical protein [Agrobacterium sp. P15N1-A]|uniref:hypothetical protein n=1 Tax=Agrobacterium sp. P15N1-A TaxID=3342820 RepID=UPI0037D0ADB7
MTKKAKGPASVGALPDRGSITHPCMRKEEMNEATNTTAAREIKDTHAADEVNRAKAIVLVVWMALQSPDLSGGCEGDLSALADTLYEAYMKLMQAEKNLGVHQ